MYILCILFHTFIGYLEVSIEGHKRRLYKDRKFVERSVQRGQTRMPKIFT